MHHLYRMKQEVMECPVEKLHLDQLTHKMDLNSKSKDLLWYREHLIVLTAQYCENVHSIVL